MPEDHVPQTPRETHTSKSNEVVEALARIFDADTGIYQQRGFQRRIMAGCVRHTCEYEIAEGFRPIMVREAVGDRVTGVVEWNLFDIDAKFGDVEPLQRVLDYLDGIPPFQGRVEMHTIPA